MDITSQATEACLVRFILCRHGHRQVGAAVVAVIKDCHRVLAGVLTRNLDGVFYCLSTGIEKNRLLFMITWGELVELLTHRNIGLIRRDHETGVGEFGSGLSHGICHALIGSTNGGHSDAGCKINVGIVIGINQDTTIGSNDITGQTRGQGPRNRSFTTRIKRSAFLPHSIRDYSALLRQVVIEVLHDSSFKLKSLCSYSVWR